MVRRTILAIGFAILIGAGWLATRPPTAPCDAGTTGVDAGREFRAVKIVVRPWLGPHHVYGIFLVPDEFASRKYGETVRVRGYEEHFARTVFSTPRQIDDVVASRGEYAKRAYVPTRVALWFLLAGRFGDLRSPCNWTLVFTNRVPSSAD